MSLAAANDVEMVEKLRDAHQRLRAEIGKVIVGQEQVLDQLLMAIFCRSPFSPWAASMICKDVLLFCFGSCFGASLQTGANRPALSRTAAPAARSHFIDTCDPPIRAGPKGAGMVLVYEGRRGRT